MTDRAFRFFNDVANKLVVLATINVTEGATPTDTAAVASAGAVMDTDYSTNGLQVRTGSGAYDSRTIQGTADRISVTDGDGVSGNPVIDLDGKIETRYIRDHCFIMPLAGSECSMGYTENALTVSKLRAVARFSTATDVRWTIRFGSDRSAAGTEIVVGGTITTNTTTGQVITTLSNASIPANSFFWIEVTASTGGVTDELYVELLADAA
jgi:hypothetical protein